MTKKGTAIVAPGQYPGLWKIGMHQGRYRALVQSSPVTVYRDNDFDSELDFVDAETGFYGINLHRASGVQESKVVGRWSAGCQVIQGPFYFELLVALCMKSASLWRGGFTYTLLDQSSYENAL